MKKHMILLREMIRMILKERSYRVVTIDNGQRRPLAGMRTVKDRSEAQAMVDTLRSYGTDDEFDIEEMNEALSKNVDIHLKSTDDEAHEIEPEIVDLVTTSYASVGGNPKIRKIGDVSSEYSDWVVADVDDEPDVDVFVGGNPRPEGTKLGVMATDGKTASKSYLTSLMKRLMTNDWWAELSDAPAHIALNKLGIKYVDNEAKVRKLLAGKPIIWHGEHPEGKFPGTHGWYSRMIGNDMHVKIIVGDV